MQTKVERLRVLFSRDEIAGEVERLAAEIRRDYQGKTPLLLGVLKGSFIFMADLSRVLDMPLDVEFIRLSSYGSSRTSSGKVRVVQGLGTSLRGRDVLVVEDIVDSGLTVSFLIEYVRRHRPASLRVCALIDKKHRRQVPLSVDYVGFDMQEGFVVGYGLDFNERYRYLPSISVLEEES